MASFGQDLLSFAVSALSLIAYHVFLRYKCRQDPLYTVQAVNRMAREAWVESVMESENKDILAVQTLRNSTMAATFLASTSILLIIGVLTLSGQVDKLAGLWHALHATSGGVADQMLLVKLLLLLLALFVAFFSFSMSIRVFNHVGYMINVPRRHGQRLFTPEHVAVHLNSAGQYYSIGMRAYYYTVPLVFWLFGPYFMLAAALGLIAVLYRIDRAPRGLAP